MKEYKHVGTHAEILASGRPVGVGELVTLTADELRDPDNARLIEEGILIPTEEDEKKPTKKEGGDR